MQWVVAKKQLLLGSQKGHVASEQSGMSQLPCSYFSQSKAWIDFNILDDVQVKFIVVQRQFWVWLR